MNSKVEYSSLSSHYFRWDDHVETLRGELDSARRVLYEGTNFQPLSVFGIKNVKGLEFENVAIVDFFGCISKECQKHWTFLIKKLDSLFSETECAVRGEPSNYPLPELEIQLKLLYTAITRARSVLYFIERNECPAFTKWRDHLKAELPRKPSLVDKAVLSEESTELSKLILPDDIRHEGLHMLLYDTIKISSVNNLVYITFSNYDSRGCR